MCLNALELACRLNKVISLFSLFESKHRTVVFIKKGKFLLEGFFFNTINYLIANESNVTLISFQLLWWFFIGIILSIVLRRSSVNQNAKFACLYRKHCIHHMDIVWKVWKKKKLLYLRLFALIKLFFLHNRSYGNVEI